MQAEPQLLNAQARQAASMPETARFWFRARILFSLFLARKPKPKSSLGIARATFLVERA